MIQLQHDTTKVTRIPYRSVSRTGPGRVVINGGPVTSGSKGWESQGASRAAGLVALASTCHVKTHDDVLICLQS